MHPAPNLAEAPPKASSAEEGSRAGSVPHQQPSTPQPSHDALPTQLSADAPPQQRAENEMDHDHDHIMSPAPPPSLPPPPHQPEQQLQQPQHFEPLGTPIGAPVVGAHVGSPLGAPLPSTPPPMRKDTNSSISTQATLATTASAATNISLDNSNSSYSADTSPTMTSVFHVKDGVDVSNRVRASRRRTGPLSQQQREKAALIRKLGACPDCRRRRVAVSLSPVLTTPPPLLRP
jgi:hypothetical protein